MANGRKTRSLPLLALTVLGLAACGPELALEPRKDLTPDDLKQVFSVTVFANVSGASGYLASATFQAPSGSSSPSLTLPVGDTITLNGAALKETSAGSGVYSTNGTGDAGTYAFVWTHGTTTYTNTFTSTLVAPASAPTTFSKGTPETVQVNGAPTGMSVNATINRGTTVASPFYGVPVEVTGGGKAASVVTAYSSLANGAGVMTVVETEHPALQAPTAAGGTATINVQFGYNVMITD